MLFLLFFLYILYNAILIAKESATDSE